MPIWLLVIVCLLGGFGLCILVHIVLMLIGGCALRDNIVFENKYKRKIYQLKEKLKKYEEKIKD